MKREFQQLLLEKDRDRLPNVLIASAECAPISKTGGLADVVGALPKCLAALGVDARVITPYHRCVKDKYQDRVEHMFSFSVDLGWRSQYVGIERLVLDGVTIYLVDNEYYFGDRIYRGGVPEGEQYAFFTRAVLHLVAVPVLHAAVIGGYHARVYAERREALGQGPDNVGEAAGLGYGRALGAHEQYGRQTVAAFVG